MTTRQHLTINSLPLFTVAACLGIFLAIFSHYKLKPQTYFNLPVVDSILNPTPTTEPTPAVSTSSQPSPDGAKKLTLTETTSKDLTKLYTFTAANADGSKQFTIYTASVSAAESMSIPFNTWSPDDNYVFITHTTGDLREALVFRADGQPLTEQEKYYEVEKSFAAQGITNTYQETTGWASETLLIVNSITASRSIQSYWFEVPSKAIIPLSTNFYN